MKRVACLLLLLVTGNVARAAAQERRVAVPVDYIAAGDVYVALGSRDGMAQGDTVPVYRDATGERSGVLWARVVTLRRSVLAFAGDRFAIAAGDTLWVGVQRPALEPAAATPVANAVPAAAPPPPAPASPRRVRTPRLDGRIGLDVDAIQSDAFEGGVRRYTTPTLRLQAVAGDLPGGFRFVTNVRASRRSSNVAGLDPVTSLRVYQAVVEKTFTALPLLLQAGRFAPSLEAYGGYWDGVLVRVGGDRLGIGAAAGFLPSLANEGFSTDVPRFSAFADHHVRRRTVGYDAELGVHALRPRTTLADQTFIGLAQRLRWQRVLFSQTLQVDRRADAGWTVSALQASATVPMAQGWAARAGGSRNRVAELGGLAPLPSFDRDRGYLGLAYFGSALSLSADLALTRLIDGRTMRGWATSLQLPRAVAGVGVGGSASLSHSETMNTTYLSGELWRSLGRAYARLGIRTTRYDGPLTDTRSTGGEATFTIPLAGSTQAMVRLETWWGTAGGGRQRIFTSLWTGL